jgi:hypothetical protein
MAGQKLMTGAVAAMGRCVTGTYYRVVFQEADADPGASSLPDGEGATRD